MRRHARRGRNGPVSGIWIRSFGPRSVRRLHLPGGNHAEGQIIILFALFSIVLIGILALAVDIGYLLSQRREVQSAADAGALAGVSAMAAGASSESINSAVISYLNANGLAADATFDIERTGDENNGTVRVSVEQPVDRFFLGAIYQGVWQVGATALAEVESVPGDYGLLVLGDLVLDGNPTINIEEGSLRVNGTIELVTQGRVIADHDVQAGEIITLPGGEWRVSSRDGDVSTGLIPVEDPLADVIVPPQIPAIPSAQDLGGFGATLSCAEGTSLSSDGLTLSVQPARYVDARLHSNGDCFVGQGDDELRTIRFNGGNYVFEGGAGIYYTDYHNVRRIDVEFRSGTYHFSGAGGLHIYGSENVTLYPGTYVFDNSDGFFMEENSTLIFKPGHYEFYFRDADFVYEGQAEMVQEGDTTAQWVFLNGNLDIVGNGASTSNFPSGNYFFRDGHMLVGLHTDARGDDTFFYFTGEDSWLSLAQCAQFQFSAPNYAPYSGGVPGLLILGGVGNTSEFQNTASQWSGNNEGLIYTPDATWRIGLEWGDTYRILDGQLLTKDLIVVGNKTTTIVYDDYVEVPTTNVWLIE